MTDGDNNRQLRHGPGPHQTRLAGLLLIILKSGKSPLILRGPNPLPDHPAISKRTFHNHQNKDLNLERTSKQEFPWYWSVCFPLCCGPLCQHRTPPFSRRARSELPTAHTQPGTQYEHNDLTYCIHEISKSRLEFLLNHGRKRSKWLHHTTEWKFWQTSN